MMVRLRKLHRVEDVRLNESARESGDSEATVDSCGSFYSFDLTVTFALTPPVSEAPRGVRARSASLGRRLVTLTDRDRKIMIAVVPIVLLLAYWFLLLSPKRQEVTKATEELTKREQRLDAARQQADAAKSAKTDFASDYAEIVRLGKAIPSVGRPAEPDRAARQRSSRHRHPVHEDRDRRERDPGAGGGGAGLRRGSATTSRGRRRRACGCRRLAGSERARPAAESANNARQTANQRSSAAEQSGVGPSVQTSTSRGGALPVGGGAAAGTGTTAGASPAGFRPCRSSWSSRAIS